MKDAKDAYWQIWSPGTVALPTYAGLDEALAEQAMLCWYEANNLDDEGDQASGCLPGRSHKELLRDKADRGGPSQASAAVDTSGSGDPDANARQIPSAPIGLSLAFHSAKLDRDSQRIKTLEAQVKALRNDRDRWRKRAETNEQLLADAHEQMTISAASRSWWKRLTT